MTTKTIERTKLIDTIIPGYCPDCGWKGNLAEANQTLKPYHYLNLDKEIVTDYDLVRICPVCGTEAEEL